MIKMLDALTNASNVTLLVVLVQVKARVNVLLVLDQDTWMMENVLRTVLLINTKELKAQEIVITFV